MNAAQIIDASVQQIGTDASRAVLLTLLNECYASQVADARWFRTEASIGTTTANTGDYPLPTDIIEGFGLMVGGYPYEPIGEDAMRRIRTSQATVRAGRYGVFSQGYDATGNTILMLWPTPTQSGQDINLYAARQPAALADSSGSVPITPPDKHPSLIAGLAALVLLRIDEREDLAGPFQQQYTAGTEALRRRKNQLLRGGKPVQLGVMGVHW